MNKTVNINLGGIIFHLDEWAYSKFKAYLEDVKNALSNEEGGAEIVADIEARIAELFTQFLKENNREVIVESDVERIIETLGRPEEFTDHEDSHEFQTSSQQTKNKRRFYRNPDDKFLGGVCGGIGAYFDVDPVWIRLAFVALLLLQGIGFWPYVILWMIIPKAKTTAQKLQMRGEPVNLSNIEKSVKEELNEVKDRFNKYRNNSNAGDKIGNAVQRFLNFIINLFEAVFGFVLKFIGLILMVFGGFIAFIFLITIIVLVSTLWGGIGSINIDGHLLGINGAQALMGTGLGLNLLRIGSILTLIFPVLGLILLIAKAIKKPVANARTYTLVGFTSFIIGLVMIIASGIQVAKDFVKEATEMTVIELQGTSFNLQANAFENQGNFLFEVDNDLLNIENISLNIKKAHDSTATLALNHRAKGQNNSEARHRATQFHYPVEQTGEQLLFKESFQVPVSAKYRAQELRATLYLPLGATVFLDPSVENLIFNIDNVHNMWDGDMIGHWFVMKEAGLTCMDCEDVKFYHDYEMDEDDEGIDQAKEAIERQIESLENELNRLQNR